QSKLAVSSKAPTVYMLVGLQGAGKTTTAAKLGGVLKKQGNSTITWSSKRATACRAKAPPAWS
ncbi:MAG: zeta toxin family protein, partial [Clostridia bacterium]|nr:zeta toxin family protein [Clostridia bacterium]